MYKCQHRVFIYNSTRFKLKLITDILSNPSSTKLEMPIYHIIKGELDFTTFCDAYLEAGGEISQNLVGGILDVHKK